MNTYWYRIVEWNGSGKGPFRTYEIYERLPFDDFVRETEHDRDIQCASRLYSVELDLFTGDIYRHVRSVPEENWLEDRVRWTAEGSDMSDYEEIPKGHPLVSEDWLKENAVRMVGGLLRARGAV